VAVGLGYGSGSESDDERENDGDSASPAGRESPAAESSDDDDELLQDRIRHKKMEFERKMRELEERENGEQQTCLPPHLNLLAVMAAAGDMSLYSGV